MTVRGLLIIIATAIALSGCSSMRGPGQDQPIGIGSSPNDLKKSPCACLVLPNAGKPQGALS